MRVRFERVNRGKYPRTAVVGEVEMDAVPRVGDWVAFGGGDDASEAVSSVTFIISTDAEGSRHSHVVVELG